MNKMMASLLIAQLNELIEEHGDLPIYVRADDYGWCDGASFEESAGKSYRDDVSPAFVIDAKP